MAAISNNTFELGTHPTKDTIKLITSLLEKITQNNDRLNTNKQATSSVYTCFHARSKPSISIHAYFTRIVKYCPCANECLIALLVYFDRMTRPQLKIAPLQIDSYNIHRLIITGLMISSKLYSDVFFTNTRYAKVGGLPVTELNALELEFLSLNNYNLFVTIDELQTYADNILEHWNSQLADKSDHVTKGLQKLHIKEEPSHDRQWKFNKTDNGLIKYSNPMDAAGETMRRLSGSATILRRESL